jgi:hypothetical protein
LEEEKLKIVEKYTLPLGRYGNKKHQQALFGGFVPAGKVEAGYNGLY